jgi:mono/diheme cytochrome c family protein
MLANMIGWLALVGLAIFFAWLAWRSWRAKNAFLKWGGLVLSGLFCLVFLLLSGVTLLGLVRVYWPVRVSVPDIQVAGTPEQIARGEYLANSFCAGCHSTDGELPLTGGLDLGQDIPMPLGSFVSVNLTPAGPLKDWSDEDIFQALRHGYNPKGRKLIMMSNVRVRYMSDEDILAIIAYLRNQPAVPNDTLYPPDRPSFLAVAMAGAGMLPLGLPPVEGVITAPPKGPTAEYGEYIVGYQDCRDCHGEDLRGGVEGQLGPIGPPLMVVKSWSAQDFINTMRTGVDPSGHQMLDTMPWKQIGRMDDAELTAMHAYLSSLP